MSTSITFTKNGTGFYLTGPGLREKLNYAEAAALLSQLLTEIPGIPSGVRNAWQVSATPRYQILQMFRAEAAEVKPAGYRAVVTVCGVQIDSQTADTTTELCLYIFEKYGPDTVYIGQSNDEISRKLAQRTANDQGVELACAQLGLTRKELERRLIRGEL